MARIRCRLPANGKHSLIGADDRRGASDDTGSCLEAAKPDIDGNPFVEKAPQRPDRPFIPSLIGQVMDSPLRLTVERRQTQLTPVAPFVRLPAPTPAPTPAPSPT